MIAQRKALRRGLAAIGHMAVRAALDERAHDRGPERPGPAGHDDMTVAIVHLGFSESFAPGAAMYGTTAFYGKRGQPFSPIGRLTFLRATSLIREGLAVFRHH